MGSQLTPGDAMPPIHGKDADGEEIDIVAAVAGKWAVIQLYRGHW